MRSKRLSNAVAAAAAAGCIAKFRFRSAERKTFAPLRGLFSPPSRRLRATLLYPSLHLDSFLMEPPTAFFKGYEKMYEDTQSWELTDADARALKRTPCVVLEKIHGAKCVPDVWICPDRHAFSSLSCSVCVSHSSQYMLYLRGRSSAHGEAPRYPSRYRGLLRSQVRARLHTSALEHTLELTHSHTYTQDTIIAHASYLPRTHSSLLRL